MYVCMNVQARSQPARWGEGSELGWVEHQAHPPPLDIVRVTSSTYSKGGTKLLKGGTKLLKGGTKSLGWATGGGVVRPPPDPPPPWLRA